MPTYQVEEYYTHIAGLSLSDGQKEKIEAHLGDEGFTNYEFQDDDSVLVVDDLESESDGDNLEAAIMGIIAT